MTHPPIYSELAEERGDPLEGLIDKVAVCAWSGEVVREVEIGPASRA